MLLQNLERVKFISHIFCLQIYEWWVQCFFISFMGGYISGWNIHSTSMSFHNTWGVQPHKLVYFYMWTPIIFSISFCSFNYKIYVYWVPHNWNLFPLKILCHATHKSLNIEYDHMNALWRTWEKLIISLLS